MRESDPAIMLGIVVLIFAFVLVFLVGFTLGALVL